MDARTRMLKATVSKLHRRGAEGNIRRILERTHTADAASLLDSLGTEERLSVFALIEDKRQRADVVSYLNETIQEEILSILSNAEIREIVSLMDRDDAADLLRRLPEETSKSVLNSMVAEESKEVEELMAYPEGTAGSMMSSEVIGLPENLTVGEAISAIQKEEDDQVAFYIYVINTRAQLVGVLSLKQLILSRPSQKLRDIMSTDVIHVQLSTPAADVAHVVEKYDFLSVPVVDEDHKLVGIITVDDVIDVIREEASEDFLSMGRAGWSGQMGVGHHLRARLPWLFLAYGSGVLCFALIYGFLSSAPELQMSFWLDTMAFIPLLIFVSSTLAQQTATFTVEGLRSGELSHRTGAHLRVEVIFGVLVALILGGLSYAFLEGTLDSPLSPWLSLALGLQVLVSVLFGSLMPLVTKRLGGDPAVSSLPFVAALGDIAGIALLLLILKQVLL